eukprot:TRINITY_DN8726_c0_g1_i1.p1 TRINITY_DN8726_c0_g1~~TRINITY_DN8726_c0_g1_i1.p1  ORF type:complete len:272 (+),score=35.00 TRINITY_DN8726_c0_g1_i1:15-830(+)
MQHQQQQNLSLSTEPPDLATDVARAETKNAQQRWQYLKTHLRHSTCFAVLLVWWIASIAYIMASAGTGWLDFSFLTIWTWVLQTCFFTAAIPCYFAPRAEKVLVGWGLSFVHGVAWQVFGLATVMTIMTPEIVWHTSDSRVVAVLYNVLVHYLPMVFVTIYEAWRHRVIRRTYAELWSSRVVGVLHALYVCAASLLWSGGFVLAVNVRERYPPTTLSNGAFFGVACAFAVTSCVCLYVVAMLVQWHLKGTQSPETVAAHPSRYQVERCTGP